MNVTSRNFLVQKLFTITCQMNRLGFTDFAIIEFSINATDDLDSVRSKS